MKNLLKNLIAMLLVFICPEVRADSGGNVDKTSAPYFQVASESTGVEPLPLQSTSAEVKISGVIADVALKQTYQNRGKSPIEAVYVFPGSTRAALYKMQLKIGERTIEAKIQERESARKDYERAKLESRTASLLEQYRPNVFQMNVGNILPGDVVEVHMAYTELLIPNEGTYEFVLPTVVGPRYSNGSNEVEKWVANPYLSEGQPTPSTFAFNATISAGMDLEKISSSSHKVAIKYNSKDEASITLDPQENSPGNRDIILQYKLAGNQIKTGMLLNQGSDENFFLIMGQPPERVTPSSVVAREYIFIVDVSGSMHGFPIEVSKKLMKNLLSTLRPGDFFNVILFAGTSALMEPSSVQATPQTIATAEAFINAEQGSGGTELLRALKLGLGVPRREGVSRSIVLATDGYVDVEKEAFSLVREKLGDANFYAFGIGSAVNRHLMEGLAHVGLGESFIVTDASQAEGMASRFVKYVQSPVLTSIKVAFDGFDAYDVEPIAQPDLLSERPLVIFGKWRGTLQGSVRISGVSEAGAFEKVIEVKSAHGIHGNSALRYLWARDRVRRLSDFAELFRDDSSEVTQIGLKYNLLTKYTSFLAVDSMVRSGVSPSTTVLQPLPLPQGVSNYAVSSSRYYSGGSVGSEGGGFSTNYNDERISGSVNTTLAYMEGSFGALVMLVSALLGLVFVVSGFAKKSWKLKSLGLACILVALSTFGMRSFLLTYFNDIVYQE